MLSGFQVKVLTAMTCLREDSSSNRREFSCTNSFTSRLLDSLLLLWLLLLLSRGSLNDDDDDDNWVVVAVGME